MHEQPILRIGIAVVLHEGRVLVGQRGAEQTLAMLREFPGGKCLPEETVEACAMRECLEETGIEVQVERLLQQTVHEYPHGTVDLSFIVCSPLTQHAPLAPFRWVSLSELQPEEFPAANREVIAQLQTIARTP